MFKFFFLFIRILSIILWHNIDKLLSLKKQNNVTVKNDVAVKTKTM